MLKTMEIGQVPITPRKPDGTLTTQSDNQIFVMEVFFNHDSKETFQDKLLRVVLADKGGDYSCK